MIKTRRIVNHSVRLASFENCHGNRVFGMIILKLVYDKYALSTITAPVLWSSRFFGDDVGASRFKAVASVSVGKMQG